MKSFIERGDMNYKTFIKTVLTVKGLLEDDQESTEDLKDCPACGAESTVSQYNGYPWEDEVIDDAGRLIKIKKELDIHICSDCGAELYDKKAAVEIMEAKEKAKGHNYIRFHILDGHVTSYSLH